MKNTSRSSKTIGMRTSDIWVPYRFSYTYAYMLILLRHVSKQSSHYLHQKQKPYHDYQPLWAVTIQNK